jgi:hypothetical protein
VTRRPAAASRRALRAWLIAAPVFLACSAVPEGGLGRSRGYVDVDLYGRYAEDLLHGRLPYRDVFVEYPPGAFAVLLPPALVTDEHYRQLFKLLMAVVALVGLWCVARLLAAFGAGTGRLLLALGFVAISPLLLGSVWLNSYDAWPATLTVAALLALCTGYVALAFACLGLAVSAKIYALALVVPAALYVVSRQGPRALARAAGGFVAAALVTAMPFLAVSADGVWSSVRSQLERGLHVESLGGSLLLAADRLGLYDATVREGATGAKSRDLVGGAPHLIAVLSAVLLTAAIVTVWMLFARDAADDQRLAVGFAAGAAGVLTFSKVLSPQYAEWLLFLVPLVPGATGVAACTLTALAFLLAEAWFHHYHELYAVGGTVWLVLIRNLAFGCSFAVLAGGLVRKSRPGSVSPR